MFHICTTFIHTHFLPCMNAVHASCIHHTYVHTYTHIQKGSIRETAMHLAAAEGHSEICVLLYEAAPEVCMHAYQYTCMYVCRRAYK
jgi:hypothetical protein